MTAQTSGVAAATMANGHLSPSLTFYPANGLNPYTGYGRVELGLARGMQSLGVDLRVWPDGSPVLAVGSAEWLEAPQMRGQRQYLYTMSETDQVSERWVELINRRCHAVFVPCGDLVGVYRDSGVDVPVHNVSLGVDLFAEGLLEVSLRRGPGRPFTFLTYSLGDARKGAELTIMAFLRTFEGDENFRLVIKVRDNYNVTWLEGFEHPQVEVIADVQTNEAWVDLLASADCFVFPSKGEGFGMPPREATLAGIPTIATEWLGMADVSQWGISLKVARMQQCAFDYYGANAEGAKWAYPDLDHLIERMTWVVEHYPEAVEVARHGREYLWTHFRWDTVARRILGVIHGTDG